MPKVAPEFSCAFTSAVRGDFPFLFQMYGYILKRIFQFSVREIQENGDLDSEYALRPLLLVHGRWPLARLTHRIHPHSLEKIWPL